MASLILLSSRDGQKIKLGQTNTIGRDESNQIEIPHASISKMHARITLDRYNRCIITDCLSTNGTFVNNIRVYDKTTLYNGDQIRLGEILFQFEAEKRHAAQIVEIGDETEGMFSQTMSPLIKNRFLPEEDIDDEAALRADYEKLRVTYELQRDMGLDKEIDKILDRILDKTFEFLQYDQGVILLADKSNKMVPHSYKTKHNQDRIVISSTLINHVKEKKTGVISTDIESDQRFNDADSIILEGIKSTISVPILHGEELLGIMIIYSLEITNTFTEKDLSLITNIANQAAQIIKNSLLHDELRLSFESSIRTLAATVDARHPLTAGHSERVAEISILIGREMGMKENELETLKFAALLHDIGKIGIRDNILLKNGPFTPEERTSMNTHPTKSEAILNNFHFPKSLEQVPGIAGAHHEKMDGNGYPNALKGKRIPLASRIMAVADVFDALTDKRDYPKYLAHKNFDHDPLPLDDVVSVIRNNAGTHFDPQVVQAFLNCLPDILSHIKRDGGTPVQKLMLD